jgi:hypothetical protein
MHFLILHIMNISTQRIIDILAIGVLDISKLQKAKERLPLRLQRLVSEAANVSRAITFNLKYVWTRDGKVPNPATVYFVSPNRIIKHTNYTRSDIPTSVTPADRVFPNSMRGKIVGGNWDISDYKFADLDVFQALKKRVEEGEDWANTKFYDRVLEQVRSGRCVWGIKNEYDLVKHCKLFDSLYKKIETEGYHLNQDRRTRINLFHEIEVNIGRNGEYMFQNGVHRLSIAKILGINCIPVMIFVRHKKWQDFRECVSMYAQTQKNGKLYQPPIHPDLGGIPYDHQSHNWLLIMEAIEKNLSKRKGLMLDIGANLGFFCHKFEDIGYSCYAIEQESITARIAEKIKIAENKKFAVINKSIFETEFVRKMRFDVVLALNIFHHFLKTETSFSQFKSLLKNLKTRELFFEPHLHDEIQMKNAYINLNETEFVDFILDHASLNKAKLIFTDPSGRQIFKLSK